MAGRRKKFLCGHVGKGQYCHRCEEEEAKARKALEVSQAALVAKQDWAACLLAAPVPLEGVPKPIAVKALQIMAALSSGTSYLAFRGKRLVAMGQRTVISVPIGRHYRLICKEQDHQLHYEAVITHEAYNGRLSSGGWGRES